MHRIIFKLLLIKIYLNLAITRFLSYNINKIYNYIMKIANRFL